MTRQVATLLLVMGMAGCGEPNHDTCLDKVQWDAYVREQNAMDVLIKRLEDMQDCKILWALEDYLAAASQPGDKSLQASRLELLQKCGSDPQ